jgi:hypothetical protein
VVLVCLVCMVVVKKLSNEPRVNEATEVTVTSGVSQSKHASTGRLVVTGFWSPKSAALRREMNAEVVPINYVWNTRFENFNCHSHHVERWASP